MPGETGAGEAFSTAAVAGAVCQKVGMVHETIVAGLDLNSRCRREGRTGRRHPAGDAERSCPG